MKTVLESPLTLGIIVCYGNKNRRPPFSEAAFFQQLTQVGKGLGIQVIVFSPRHIDWKTRTVPAWFVEANSGWGTGIKPLPSLIYDRCFYLDTRHYMAYKPYVQRIAQDPHIRLLGRALGGKHQTYEILKQSPVIKPFLPPTTRYQTPQDLIRLLKRHGSLLIKPNGGSHGRGVAAITLHPRGHYEVRGRSRANEPFQHSVQNEEKLQMWAQQFIQDTRYIIQPFLSLFTPDRRPFDLRILVQKNERKEWETTGTAVRIGKAGTVTSNLHGGGQATSLRPFLDQHYPAKQVPPILEKIEKVSSAVPPFIEVHHGPLLELGLDVGIDLQGRVWLLEVNSKPGRTIFLKTGEMKIRQRAVQLPMFYAHSLLKGHLGGSV
ncbi:YheC/YheD family protein [Paenactinomyces guangxiensis]|uniref:YheC/YheD family protein n=1 Tax=Paenactinomyces guangxiensis TaxID=1490290 RepID=A0A7W1WSX3_9BACL|nr:YheC/YheD family protein [Paenactinomyces guangxiensis]MBA4495251.1 YheC/YheD family protein [Paenactinomyces guangxiensis]MBH8592335.1 YheC/YheD family protein [Paenactinomyces guangxiensis]